MGLPRQYVPSERLLRRYEQKETADHGECVVELVATGWELYEIRINGHFEGKWVGIDNAIYALERFVNTDDPEWVRTDLPELESQE